MLHALPVRVHVVVRRVGVQGALVARDFLHEPALNEAVLRVEKGATEETNHRGMPIRLLYELFDVPLCFLAIVVCGEAHREEGGREAFEHVAVLPDEIRDVTLMLAHVDGRPDDHRVVAVGCGVVIRALDVHRLRVNAMVLDHGGDVLGDPGRLPLRSPVRDQHTHDATSVLEVVRGSVEAYSSEERTPQPSKRVPAFAKRPFRLTTGIVGLCNSSLRSNAKRGLSPHRGVADFIKSFMSPSFTAGTGAHIGGSHGTRMRTSRTVTRGEDRCARRAWRRRRSGTPSRPSHVSSAGPSPIRAARVRFPSSSARSCWRRR